MPPVIVLRLSAERPVACARIVLLLTSIDASVTVVTSTLTWGAYSVAPEVGSNVAVTSPALVWELPTVDAKLLPDRTPAVRDPLVTSLSPVIAVPAVMVFAFVALNPVALAVALLLVIEMVLSVIAAPSSINVTDSMVDVTSAALVPACTDNNALPVSEKSTEVSDTRLRTFVTLPAVAVAAKLFEVIDRAESVVAPVISIVNVPGAAKPSSVMFDVTAADWL